MSWPDFLSDLLTPTVTLAGVGLTLYFTGRRESKRLGQQLAFEREKLALSQRDARDGRLHDQRVQLFSTFLDICVNLHSRTYELRTVTDIETRREMVRAVEVLRRESRQTGIRVVLLAPGLRDAANKARSFLLKPKLADNDELTSEWRVEANTAISHLTRAMSRELGIEFDGASIARGGD